MSIGDAVRKSARVIINLNVRNKVWTPRNLRIPPNPEFPYATPNRDCVVLGKWMPDIPPVATIVYGFYDVGAFSKFCRIG